MQQTTNSRTRAGAVQAGKVLRPLVQGVFLLLVLVIGAQFTYFVWQLERGQEPAWGRPPGVEAFLPISALIGLKYWFLTGIFNRIHPAGLVLLLVILAISLVLKRGFCSWVCPFGLLGDCLERVHRRLLGGRLSLPRVLDYPLRSLKYLLLLFFLWAIFVRMDVGQLGRFIDSPYNRVADVKMLKFFAQPSPPTLVVLAILTGLSFLIPFFWCRYLCPYGALLGAVSVLSPFKVRRDEGTCTQCRKCSQVCPARIRVHRVGQVWSDECHACWRCVDACPVAGTLRLSAVGGRLFLTKPLYAAAVILLLASAVLAGRLTGHWHSAISTAEYQRHLQLLHHPAYSHNRGTVPEYRWDELGIHQPVQAAGRAPSGQGR